MKGCVVVTGTGTGVGKTVLTSLLVRRLLARGVAVAAFKPLCSGGRADAKVIRAALGDGRELDAINPWWFRPPLAPALAARLAGRQVAIADIVGHVRRHAGAARAVVVEGAGGLLSPLAMDGDAPDLIRALRAAVVLVASDRLGVVHEVRATLAALPSRKAAEARVVLMAAARPDPSARYNAGLLGELLGSERIHRLGRLRIGGAGVPVGGPATWRATDTLIAGLGLAG